jgi:ligand-binding SRPBCC domain-containing protein
MKYVHRFVVQAPLSAVKHFHTRASTLKDITPPLIFMQVHNAPAVMGEGDTMDFTMWLGPIPIRWCARIENEHPRGFWDRQVSGPFASWLHHHSFAPLGPDQTEVLDEVEATLHSNWYYRIVGVAMWVGLPLLFAYRSWRTRSLLQNTAHVTHSQD